MAGRPVKGDCRFVGRGEELARFAEAGTQARHGFGRLLVVRGEPGIGKTTLCEQAAQRAERSGFSVGWGRCWSDGGAPPMWPWPAVLDQLGGTDAARLLAEDPGVPGLDHDRFARFHAVADRLAEQARRQPLMIVIDDAHVADPAAVLLARLLVRALDRSPVVLVLTRRNDGGIGSVATTLLDELEREAAVVPL
jgi:predicted ATPase